MTARPGSHPTTKLYDRYHLEQWVRNGSIMEKIQQRIANSAFLFFALASCIWIYWSGLYGPLLLDDTSILGNILSPDFSSKDVLSNVFSNSGIFKRPISMLSFIANGLTSGDLFYWKFTNLLIHLICGILVYFLTLRLLRLAGRENTLLATLVATLWLLHPIQISTVLYTVQRMTQLSTLFVFAAMLTYTVAREQQRAGRNFWPMQLLTWAVLFPMGILSKENALLFFAYAGLIELFFFRKCSNYLIAIIVLLGVSAAIGALVINGGSLLGNYGARDFTPLERLMTEGRVLASYIGMLLIPAQRRMGFIHDDVAISSGLLDPLSTIASIIAIAMLIILGFALRKKHPIIGFGIILYFAGHAMESTIISLELMYEHRNYLPSYGVLLATAAAFHSGVTSKSARYVAAAIGISICVMLSYVRVDTWSSMQSLLYYMETTHPDSERLAMIKASQYVSTGQYDRARERLSGFDSFGAKLHRLEIDCIQHQRLEAGQLEATGQESLIADNYAAMKITTLANLGLDSECDFSSDSFLSFLQNAEKMAATNSNHRLIMMYTAHYLWLTGNQEAALQKLRDTHALKHSNPIPLFLACEWMLDTKRIEAATETCAVALNIAEKDWLDQYSEQASSIKTRLKAEGVEHVMARN